MVCGQCWAALLSKGACRVAGMGRGMNELLATSRAATLAMTTAPAMTPAGEDNAFWLPGNAWAAWPSKAV